MVIKMVDRVECQDNRQAGISNLGKMMATDRNHRNPKTAMMDFNHRKDLLDRKMEMVDFNNHQADRAAVVQVDSTLDNRARCDCSLRR